MRTFNALMLRERWEHPSFWIVPGVFAALIVVAHFYGVASMWRFGVDAEMIRDGIQQLTTQSGADRRLFVEVALFGFAVPFNLFLIGLMFFYSLGSLYDDRRDRSILFWKSLPVSDVETVLSKLATATLVAPALTLAVLIVLHVFNMLVVSGIALWAGADGWYTLLNPVPLVGAWAKLAWGLVAQSLVLLPIIAWLMLASAWAKKAPFLWAVVPPATVMIMERWMTGRTLVGRWLLDRFSEVLPLAFNIPTGDFGLRFGPDRVLRSEGAIELRFDILLSAGMWGGVVVAAVLLAGAVWLRRYRAEAE